MRAFFIIRPSLFSLIYFSVAFFFFPPALPQIPFLAIERELASSLGACFHRSAAICFSLSVLTLIRTQPWLLCKLQLLQVTVPTLDSYPLSFIPASQPPNLPDGHQLSYRLCLMPLRDPSTPRVGGWEREWLSALWRIFKIKSPHHSIFFWLCLDTELLVSFFPNYITFALDSRSPSSFYSWSQKTWARAGW